METITIPKKLSRKGDLIVVLRKEYENLVRSREFYTQLDRDLDKSIKQYRAGKYYGPFKTAEEGKKFLASRKRKK